jgi:recombinational DNA repair ATPase RecF
VAQCLGHISRPPGEFQIRIDGQNARSAAQLAEILPLQLINPDSFRLLEGAPKIRRQFLDWGVFHVEPRFMATWQRLQKACGSGTHGCGMVHLTPFRKRPGTGNCARPALK